MSYNYRNAPSAAPSAGAAGTHREVRPAFWLEPHAGIMSIETVADLLDTLRRIQLLAPEQVDEVQRELGPHYDDPLQLAGYLAEMNWLTPYQVKLLFSDCAEELIVGSYQILDPLREDGSSEVFKAWDTQHGRIVSLKVLHPQMGGRPGDLGPLQHELQALTRLSHAHIIRTYDIGRSGERAYIATEFVEGVDLDRFVQQVGRLAVEQACNYVRQAAKGLQHAHQLGLMHRDIKPANLLLVHPPLSPTAGVRSGGGRAPEPTVKIINWGLARLQPWFAAEPGCAGAAEPDTPAGTAGFIAPEQLRDEGVVDIRADIYSLGCTLYYLLTGKPPAPANSPALRRVQLGEGGSEPLRRLRPDVSEELACVLQRMMAVAPEDRFQIPLLAATALRHFCPSLASSNATSLRPPLNP